MKLEWFNLSKEKGGMGLRSLSDLNQALVAKLAWRFLHDQDSLLAQLLRARYLRNTSFGEAKKPSVSSTTWNAMLESRDNLKKGCLWLVGNSQSINIFSDPWVSSISRAIPARKEDGNSKIVKVSQLICSISGQWDSNLVHQNANAFSTYQILQTPINSAAPDTLIWKFTVHGEFTPQSCQKLLEEQRGESSAVREPNFPWKIFWAVKRVAPKIKAFIWRAIHNGIGVSERIGRHVEGVSVGCNLCTDSIETVDHLLIYCNYAKAVWFASPLGLRLREDHQLNLQCLLEFWLNNNDDEYCMAMGKAICLAIWKTRNAKFFEHNSSNIQGTLTIAMYWFNLYYNFSEDGETEVVVSGISDTRNGDLDVWTPPPNPFIKLNVDATWKNSSFACVVIARNSNGFCYGAATRLGTSDSVAYAEADGFLLAAEWATWLNFDTIIIEGDS